MASDFKQTDKESVSVDNKLSTTSRGSSASSAGSHRNPNLLRSYHNLAMHLFNTGPEREVEKLFLVAARDGQYDRVENFLQRRSHEIVNIDVKDPVTGNTPLIWAAKHGHEKIVQLLLKYGADVTLNNCEHQTAVEVAQPNIRRILINSVDRTGSSPRHLLQAAWQGNLKVVQKLLKESRVLDINCRNADSLTPLLLVTRDVDLFHKLGDAMKNYNPEAVIVELLLNRADPNASDNEGRTALHYTASLKCKLAEKVTLALLQDGSQVEVRDKHCVTPVHFASQNGQVEVLLALLANGANVNVRGYAGTTPLHVSAQANQFQSVNTLLNQGADITLVDDRGFTPVDVARNKKMKSTLKDAWMEATSNKQEQTVLSPVKPPSRASLSRISIDEKTPRVTPRDVHTSSPDKVNIVQKMTEAHKTLKAEEQMLKDLEADHFPPGLTSKKLKTPIPPRTPKSDKTTGGSSSNNSAPLLDRSKTKRSLLFESRIKEQAEIGHKASTKGHQKLAQRHSDPTRLDQNLVPVTIVGLDLDEHVDDMRLQRLLNSPINGILERQKKRGSLPEVNPLPSSYRSSMRRKSTPNKQTISEVLEVVNDYQKQDQIQVRFTTPSPLNETGKSHLFSKTVLPPSPGLHLESQCIIQETIFEFDSETEGSQSAIPGKRTLQNPKPDSGNHLNLSRAGTLMSQKRTFNIEMSRVKSSSESDQSSSQSSMSCTSSSMSSFSTPSPQESPRVDLISNNQNCRTTNRMGVKMTPAATVTQEESCEKMEVRDVEGTSDSVLESDQDSGVVSSSSSPPIKRSNTAKPSKKDRVLLREVSEDFTAKVFPVDCDSRLDKNLGSNQPMNDVIRVNFITSSETPKTNKNTSSDHNVSNTSKNSIGKVDSNTTNVLSSEKLTKQQKTTKPKQSPRIATSAKPSLLIQESNKVCDKICNRTVSKSAGAVKVSVTCDTVKNKLETLNPAPVMSKTSPATKPSPKISSGTPSVAKSFSGLPKEDLTSPTGVSTVKNDTKYEDVTIENGNSVKPNNVNPSNIVSVPHREKSSKNDVKDGGVNETLATKHNNHIENAKEKQTESAIKKVIDTTATPESNKPSNTCIVGKSSGVHHKNEHSSSKKQTSNDVTNKKVENLEKQKTDKAPTFSNNRFATQAVKNAPEKVIVVQTGDTPKPHILGKKLEMQDRLAEKSKTEEATTARLTPRIPSAPKPAGPGRPKSQFKSPDTSPRIKEAESGKKKPAPNGVMSGKDNKVHNTPVICDMFENMKTEVEISNGAKTVTDRKKVSKQNGRNNSGKQKRSQSAPKDKTLKESSKVANKGNPASQTSSVNKKKKISKEKSDAAGKTKGKPKPSKAVEEYQERKKTPKKRKKKPNEDTMVVKDTDANTTAFISGQGWHIKTKKNESDNVIIHNQLIMDDSSDSEGSIKLSPHNTLKIQEMAKMRSMTQEQVCNFKNVMSPLETNTPKYIPDTMGTIKTFIANAFKEDCNNLHGQLSTRQFSFEENEMKSICEAKEKEILLRKKGNKDLVEGPVKGLASNHLTPRSEVDNLTLYSESSYDTNPELLKVFKIPDHVDNEEQEVIESDVEEIEVEPVHFVEEAVKENVMDPVIEEHSNNDSNKNLQAAEFSESPGTRNSSATSTSSRISSSTIRRTKDCEVELANKPPLPSHQPKKLPKSAFKKRYSEPVINYPRDEYDELDKEYFDERVRKYSAGVCEKIPNVEPNEKGSSSTANCHQDEGHQNEAGKGKTNEFSILDRKNLTNDSKVNNIVDRNQSESDVFDDHKNNLQKVQGAQNPDDQLSADNPDKNLVDTDFLPPINLQRPSEGSDEDNDLLNDSLTLSIMSDVLEKTFNEASRAGSSWSADSVTRTSILSKGRSHSSRVSSSDRSQCSSTSVSETEEELLHWKKGNILGKGAFGQVYCGLTNTGQLIAVKQVELSERDKVKSENQYEKLQEEVELLKTLRHKNIVGFLGVSLEDNIVNIFMQFIPGGSIASLLARFGALDEPVFCRYTKQILEGIEYLHSNNVIHRDIKGANIMIMSNGIIKLIDFGCAKRLCINLSQSQSLLMSMRGTPYWMAPEVIMETGHGTKSDIWSIGCTVFEMATRKPPWAEMPPMTAIYSIGSGSGPVPQLPEQFSKEARSFVSVCLLRNQNERPTATDLLKHAFIRKRRERGRDRFSTRISSSTFEEGNINFKEKPKSEVTKDKNSKKPIYDFS